MRYGEEKPAECAAKTTEEPKQKKVEEIKETTQEEASEEAQEKIVEEDKGEMKVLGVFRTEKTSIIAGGEMLTGKVETGYLVQILRKKQVLGEAEVTSVQKEKMDVKELIAGEIGGLALKTTNRIDLAVGDRLRFFVRETRKRKLG